ncbi:hypothetical protein [Streptomyces beihaiensis]|uniref:Uncharacterized protein n=1 Tax=Streptomyces beihaiensis TaxID=2984495 RepID=A0ABT3U4F3_9ACTN|nr:hypothetical protein [Streptomyces beihaiensis]MCX3064196.1 hypothetical protein [Streptomyces beihaiensis]
MGDAADLRVSLAGQGSLVGVAATDASSDACLVNVANVTVTARVVPGVTVAALDPVLILRRGAVYYVIAVLPGAPTVTPTPAPAPDVTTDTGDSAPAPKPVTTTGTLTCHPVATATYRDGSWRSDGGSTNSFDTYQGRYAYSSFGRMTGCAFYGSKPATLSGATITKATVRLRRLSAGAYSGQRPTLRLVSQTTRPSGAPSLHESTTGPSLAVGDTDTFTLPDSWGQAMVDGTRGGLAIYVSSDDPYIRLAGRGSYSAAWTLTLYWRRTS